ncbi:MAG TPA: SET domain-containing protein-lysine N-methyltransferase [Chlamydiales bacterium]|nr:SET domain-containing protein-lysine N-methyltransferase [Chlamydiales bacterium]
MTPREKDPSSIAQQTGIPYISYLEFESFALYRKILKKTARLHRNHSIGKSRLWLSAYFQKELLSNHFPEVSLRWIDDEMGWGVFAEKEFDPMTFIAEYSGLVRRRRRGDDQNSYCFEYLIMPEEETDYLIDAQDQGGISRYINHSSSPNLSSSMISCNGVSHIILYTNKCIKTGEQLFYDYGPTYWKKRKAPR